MNKGTYPLASSMINGLNRIDVISNNLANVNTAGFKEEAVTQGTFNAYLDRAKKANQLGDDNLNDSQVDFYTNKTTNTIPKIDSKYINQSVGNLDMTGNKMDFALKDPDNFFKIELPNGKFALTRDGEFTNLNGYVVTSQGYKVLKKDGSYLKSNDNISKNIYIAKTEYKNLTKIGDNNYLELDPKKTSQVEPTSDNIIQGAIEKSNVNAVTSMIKLIEAQREFELDQKALMTIDELNDKAINKVGMSV